jgi:spermidine/putrescine transport system permease protein
MRAPASRPFLPSGLKLLDWFLRDWTTLVFIFLYVPIAVLVVYSFNSSRLSAQPGWANIKA